MWVDSKTFMELVRKQTELEFNQKCLERELEELKRRQIFIDGNASDDSSEAMIKLYREMTDGVKDEKAGRVIYTDGRD